MANTAAAKKDLRQTKKRTARNLAKKKKIKELTQATLKAIEEKSADAQEIVNKTYKALDKAAKTNTIHKNKADRMKARLQNKLNASKK
ncbi:30S ribosomal protein S20 [Patescibacteria group bacterium]